MGKRNERKTLRYRLASLVRLLAGKPRPKTAAVILAAGNGTRFGGERPKQFALLLGVPVLIRSVRAFEESPYIDEIVIVSRSEDIDEVRALCDEYGFRKLSGIVEGGVTRQESSVRGVLATSRSIEFVAVHDAARCLVTADTIGHVAAEAYVYGAASAASPVYDTVKQLDTMGFISKTIDRATLVAAETPQIFRKKLYLAAAGAAEQKGASVTDDNSLLETFGQAVKSVLSVGENFKITTASDLLRAEAVISQREGKESSAK